MKRTARSVARQPPRRAIALTLGLVILVLPLCVIVDVPDDSGMLVRLCGFFALLPLFGAIRLLSPRASACAGACWSLFLWLLLRGAREEETGPLQIAATLIASSAFAAMASFLHQNLRCGPLHLSLAYLLFEITLLPLGLDLGLLVATIEGGGLVATLGSIFGYLVVAFLVAYFNALIIALAAKLSLPRSRPGTRQTANHTSRGSCPEFVSLCTQHALVPVLARPPPRR